MGSTIRAVTVGVLLALAVVIPTAPAGATVAQSQGASADKTCKVNSDNVHYREGPGTGFKSHGMANKGQEYKVYRYENGWANGTVVNVVGNVWIEQSFLTC